MFIILQNLHRFCSYIINETAWDGGALIVKEKEFKD